MRKSWSLNLKIVLEKAFFIIEIQLQIQKWKKWPFHREKSLKCLVIENLHSSGWLLLVTCGKFKTSSWDEEECYFLLTEKNKKLQFQV